MKVAALGCLGTAALILFAAFREVTLFDGLRGISSDVPGVTLDAFPFWSFAHDTGLSYRALHVIIGVSAVACAAALLAAAPAIMKGRLWGALLSLGVSGIVAAKMLFEYQMLGIGMPFLVIAAAAAVANIVLLAMALRLILRMAVARAEHRRLSRD